MPDNDNPKFWLKKAVALSNEGKHAEAIGYFDKALGIDPGYAMAWNHKGFVLRSLGRRQEALQAFRNFIQSAGPDQAARIDKAKEIIRALEADNRHVGDREIWKVGDRIEGSYEIKEIRKGGMGTVFVCIDLKTGRPLALKTFHYECFTENGATERFLDGAETWVRLGNHENVARAYYVRNISGRPFLFLEFIPGDRKYGPDLSGWIRSNGLDFHTILDFAVQFCRGMEYAREKFGEMGRTFVHRDIKPSNILITHDKVVKVTDFDLVKTFLGAKKNVDAEVVKDERTRMERSGFAVVGSVCGTPPYMSPEQWEGGDVVDPRSDIYSFGCVLYEMLTGHPPFVRASFESYRTSHRGELPTPPKDAVPGIPQELSPLVMKCLAKIPAERFQDFAQLRQTLTDIQRSLKDPVAQPHRGDDLDELSNRGFSLAQMGKHQEALACFDKILEADPNHFMAWGNKGMVFHMLGQAEEALACIDKVLEIDPGDAAAWNNKGLILGGSGKLEEAKQCVEKAIGIEPGMASAWFNKGNFLRLERRREEAVSCYDKALEIDPRYLDAWYAKGALYGDLRKHGMAIECYDRALEINPANMTVLNDKATSLILMGRVKEATQVLDRVIETDPTVFMAWLNKASLLESQGKPQEAAACLDKMLEQNPLDPRACSHCGDIANRVGDFAKAVRLYGRALELDPKNAAVWQGKAYAHSKIDQLGEAIECYERALQINPNDPDSWYMKGELLGMTGKNAEALSCMNSALEIAPRFTGALQAKGFALVKLGRNKEAIEAYRLYLRNAEKEPPEIVAEVKLLIKDLERAS